MLLVSGIIAFFAYFLSSSKRSENLKIKQKLFEKEGSLRQLTGEHSSYLQKLLTIKKINKISFSQQDVVSLNNKEDILNKEISKLNEVYRKLKPAYDKKKRKADEEESARRRRRRSSASAIGSYGGYSSSSSSSWSSGGGGWSGGGGGFSGGGASGGW